MRILDDKIVYALNTSIPTESFQKKVNATEACQDLYSQIQKGHADREKVIKHCITVTAEAVKNLKAAKTQSSDDFEIIKNLKSEQRKVIYDSREPFLGMSRIVYQKNKLRFVLCSHFHVATNQAGKQAPMASSFMYPGTLCNLATIHFRVSDA